LIPFFFKVPDDAQLVCLEWYMSASWSPVPTSIQDPRDGTDRLFIVYQDGHIQVHRRSSGEVIGTFLTVPNVLQDGEAGLTALAFHPNYIVRLLSKRIRVNPNYFHYY